MGLSAACEAHKWLYKRKFKEKHEIISALVGTVGFATRSTGDFGNELRYRSPDLTDEMWQQARLAETELAQPAAYLKRQIELKREEQASLKTEIEQLYAGLETSDERQILHAQNLYNEGLVVMCNILRERIGVTGPDVEAAPARER
ncbi:hypothetical protein RHOSPDRAFT_31106 [Rhodotorula sp. JG-1b]|nr:hypothetical protein RHOSPDRAFT_31106 [Rhodotorula sp. JG-1b]